MRHLTDARYSCSRVYTVHTNTQMSLSNCRLLLHTNTAGAILLLRHRSRWRMTSNDFRNVVAGVVLIEAKYDYEILKSIFHYLFISWENFDIAQSACYYGKINPFTSGLMYLSTCIFPFHISTGFQTKVYSLANKELWLWTFLLHNIFLCVHLYTVFFFLLRRLVHDISQLSSVTGRKTGAMNWRL